MITIFRKEVADYFTSIRFVILLILAVLISAATLYFDWQGIRGATDTEFVFLRLFTTQPEGIPGLFTFISFTALFFVPIIGIMLGFDAINGERSSGTMSRLLAQPIFRDNVINAKFLAGLFILSVMVVITVLVIAGYGLRLIGVPPNFEEVFRLFIYLIFTVIYGAFWMALAVLFSVLFRRVSTSLLTSIAIWLFFGFYTRMIVPAVAKSAETLLLLLRFSPNALFEEATIVLLLPRWRGTGLLTVGEEIGFMIPNPLSLGQSMLLIWPQLVALIALTVVCFAISYVLFMRQEIRAT